MWVIYGDVLIYPCKTESLVSEPVYEDSGVDIVAYKHNITVVGYVNMSMLSIIEHGIRLFGQGYGQQGYGQQGVPYSLDNTPVSTFSASRPQDFNFNQTISAISRYLLTPRRRLFIGATTPPDNAIGLPDHQLYNHPDIIFVAPESKSPNTIDPYGGPLPVRSSVESIVHNNFAKVRWSCTWYSDPRRYKPSQYDFDIYAQPKLHDPIASHRYSVDISTNEHGLSTLQITATLTLNPGYYIDQKVYNDFKISKHPTVIPAYVVIKKLIPPVPMFRRTGTSLNLSQDGRKAVITVTLQEVPYFYIGQDRYGINHIDVNVRAVSELPEAGSTYMTTLEAIYKAYIAPYAHPHDVCLYLQRILNYGLLMLQYKLKEEAIADFTKHTFGQNIQGFVNNRLQKWPAYILLRGTSIDYDYSGLTCTLRASIAIFTHGITYFLYKGNSSEHLTSGSEHSLSYLFGLSLVRTAIQMLKAPASSTELYNYDPYFDERSNNPTDSYIARSIEQSSSLTHRQIESSDSWLNSHALSAQKLDISMLKSFIHSKVSKLTYTNELITPLVEQMKVFLCPISYHNVSDSDDADEFQQIQTVTPKLRQRQIILLGD
jgi:hypothetical protein